MENDDAKVRLEKLERRLDELEDVQAIHRMVVGYSFALDSGDGDAVRCAWDESGIFDRGGGITFEGAETLARQVETAEHARLLEGGLAHFVSAPSIVLDGNSARATCCNLLIERDGEGFRLKRFTINRWDLRKDAGRWIFVRRVNRLIDGAADARMLMRGASEHVPVSVAKVD